MINRMILGLWSWRRKADKKKKMKPPVASGGFSVSHGFVAFRYDFAKFIIGDVVGTVGITHRVLVPRDCDVLWFVNEVRQSLDFLIFSPIVGANDEGIVFKATFTIMEAIAVEIVGKKKFGKNILPGISWDNVVAPRVAEDEVAKFHVFDGCFFHGGSPFTV